MKMDPDSGTLIRDGDGGPEVVADEARPGNDLHRARSILERYNKDGKVRRSDLDFSLSMLVNTLEGLADARDEIRRWAPELVANVRSMGGALGLEDILVDSGVMRA